MANPNIVNVSTLTGKTSVFTLTTATQTVITNSTSSGKILKVDSLFVSNTTSTAASVTIDLFRSSVAYKITSAISVPANSTLLVIDKASNIFLEEGDTLRAIAGTTNVLQLVTSFEELS
jgi:hypothetical protein